jgi:hypothetical protein
MRLVAEHGLEGAARILRALADEIEAAGALGLMRSREPRYAEPRLP